MALDVISGLPTISGNLLKGNGLVRQKMMNVETGFSDHQARRGSFLLCRGARP